MPVEQGRNLLHAKQKHIECEQITGDDGQPPSRKQAVLLEPQS
jgi:hypothetical protein